MKNFFFALALVFTLGLSMVATDAEAAKRMGSGKSMGMQRQATPDKAPNATPAAAPAAGAAAGAAAAAKPARSWMGPLAGLAAGLGLAALASHLGFGEELASMLMIGLAVMAVLGIIAFVMRKRAANAAAGLGGAGGMQYAGAASAAGSAGNPASSLSSAPAYKTALPAAGGSMIGSSIGANVATGNAIPADFDVAGFVRNAKVNFIRLQAANDAGNLDDLREFTSPEMFAELKMELAERGSAVQKTEVVRIDADVLEVAEEANRYVVSVRFTGVVRDQAEPADEAFNEIWHLVKARDGNGGWVLSGIQQA
jgi:predicted lipid-binding transport protein (Tim44 family)